MMSGFFFFSSNGCAVVCLSVPGSQERSDIFCAPKVYRASAGQVLSFHSKLYNVIPNLLLCLFPAPLNIFSLTFFI